MRAEASSDRWIRVRLLDPEHRCAGIVTREPIDGVLHELGSRMQIELMLDALPMRFDRLHAQVERIGRLPRAHSLADQVQNL